MVYALPSMEKVFRAAGLWGANMTSDNMAVIRAYYQRPWAGTHCDFHDICLLAAERDVDPEPLILMAEAAGELEVIE